MSWHKSWKGKDPWKWQGQGSSYNKKNWRNSGQWRNDEEEEDWTADASTSSGNRYEALGHRTFTQVYIAGPFFDGIPDELYERCGKSHYDKIDKHLRQWRENEEKRKSYCKKISLDKNCGYYIVDRIKQHYQTLRELGYDFSAEEERGEDPLTEKVLQHLIGTCTECLSPWHMGTPPGFCPNEVLWAEYRESITNPDVFTTVKPDKLAEDQRKKKKIH